MEPDVGSTCIGPGVEKEVGLGAEELAGLSVARLKESV